MFLYLGMPAAAHERCRQSLSLDERYDLVPLAAPRRAWAPSVQRLLTEAFSPLTREMGRRFRMTHPYPLQVFLSSSAVADFMAKVPNKNAAQARLVAMPPGLDREFDGRLSAPVYLDVGYSAPFTAFNRDVMVAAMLASLFVSLEIIPTVGFLAVPGLRGSEHLRNVRTFAGDQLHQHLEIAILTTLQAVAALTAEPVGRGSTAWTQLEEVTRPSGRKPSLAVKLALALGPSVIGPFGGTFYVGSALVVREGGNLQFSDKMMEFFKESKRLFNRRNKSAEELGTGCPVAHRERSACPPALEDWVSGFRDLTLRIAEIMGLNRTDDGAMAVK